MYILNKEGQSPKDPVTETKTKTQSDVAEAPVIVCRACHAMITEPDDQTTRDGAFAHTFANPHGYVFEIGCFAQAPGCVAASPFSSEFTWFAGYQWQAAACGRCGDHKGWIFVSEKDRFFGLIFDKLIFP